MTTFNPPPQLSFRPPSARGMAKPVNFYLARPGARSVCLIGDFNGWTPGVHVMRKRPDGWWFAEVPLTHGHHRYLFLVDDVPTLDPAASGTVVMNPFGKASVMAVS